MGFTHGQTEVSGGACQVPVRLSRCPAVTVVSPWPISVPSRLSILPALSVSAPPVTIPRAYCSPG
ncbi:hypothetical protein O0544_12785 [Edwardsiella anguillarum]|nr:hypothetical protein [Edwardsiella anguillarum]